ncbi:MAG: FMN-dependent NADH-azoreductase [Candidatus Woesearchaeota archaeon]
MKKTLLIHYLPRKEESNTRRLVDEFKKHVKGELEEVDLTSNIPDMFIEKNLRAYFKRDYFGEKLAPDEKRLLRKMDRFAKQAKEADVIVLAYPMFNFSVPAVVKAYLDSIAIRGKTWGDSEHGIYGMLEGKKALILTTSGGTYTDVDGTVVEYSTTLASTIFGFLGIEDIESIKAEGMYFYPEKQEIILKKAMGKIPIITSRWYG